METFWYIMIFIFGAIIGSFLNVVIYRMHTGKSINGRSHCMTCGTHLTWYELFPIFSYLALRAKCRTCRAFIPSRYLIVETLTGTLFLVVFLLYAHTPFVLGMYFILVALLVVTLVYDIRHTIIPDELTFMIGGVALCLLMFEVVDSLGWGIDVFFQDILAGLIASGFFAGLWYFSKGKWIGFGDAKLALPLGMIVGLSGVFSMVVLSFWIGAGISLTILLVQRLMKRWKTRLPYLHETITMKSEVPFAPFLIAGFILVELFHADIFVITNTLLPF